ncbi:hypothetical protein THAOC_17290 [Thalassiosira oceanica]|uniref:Spindle pole body component n=1 Tax=Thalassiosira oceanica TaxID=159749 RepID=K0SV40_THAOC|nr:hypothetical protein THAOC_17290 [Thalassiosira oceanica]|eukprot:EJK62112.1 hypothetical protein THAOC_17290 [Thalassiosira oceanica]
MRGADGTYLRHVPDENGQGRGLWTEYRRGGDDEAPQLVPEGVSLAPETAAVPELLHEEDLMERGRRRDRQGGPAPALGPHPSPAGIRGARRHLALRGVRPPPRPGRLLRLVGAGRRRERDEVRHVPRLRGTSRAGTGDLSRASVGVGGHAPSAGDAGGRRGRGRGGLPHAPLALGQGATREGPPPNARDALRRGRHAQPPGRASPLLDTPPLPRRAHGPLGARPVRRRRRQQALVRHTEEVDATGDAGGRALRVLRSGGSARGDRAGRRPPGGRGHDLGLLHVAPPVRPGGGAGASVLERGTHGRDDDRPGAGGASGWEGDKLHPVLPRRPGDPPADPRQPRVGAPPDRPPAGAQAVPLPRAGRLRLESCGGTRRRVPRPDVRRRDLRPRPGGCTRGGGPEHQRAVHAAPRPLEPEGEAGGGRERRRGQVLDGSAPRAGVARRRRRRRTAARTLGRGIRQVRAGPLGPRRARVQHPESRRRDRALRVDGGVHAHLPLPVPPPAGGVDAQRLVAEEHGAEPRDTPGDEGGWGRRPPRGDGGRARLVSAQEDLHHEADDAPLHIEPAELSHVRGPRAGVGRRSRARSGGRGPSTMSVRRTTCTSMRSSRRALRRVPRGGPRRHGGSDSCRSLEYLLRRLLTTALRFGKFQEHIFANSIRGLDRAARVRRRVEERADRGDWGRTTLDEEEGQVFRYLADASLFDFVERTTRSFDGALGELLRTMGRAVDEVELDVAEDNGDDEYDGAAGPSAAGGRTHDALPFLLFRLDFSGYYQRMARENKRRKKKAAATATAS